MQKFLLIYLIALVNFLPAHAAQLQDSRIKSLVYHPDHIVKIYGTTFITTQIIFNQDESIVDVQNGDAAAWYVHINKNVAHILNIKPTIVDSDTDMSVVTTDSQNQVRRYYFNLVSNKQTPQEYITYAIKFIYPAAKNSYPTVGNKQKNYNYNYTFNGCNTIKPKKVFDDGVFTYFEFATEVEIPAIFAVDNPQGEEALVNSTMNNGYLVVKRLSPQFTLRAGSHCVASLFNEGNQHGT